jgi:hypothetical protein
VLRGHAGEPEHVLVTATLGAPQRRLLGNRPRPAGTEPSPVPTARATLVAASPFDGEQEAAAWLRAAGEDEIDDAVAVLNRVLHLQRTAAFDAYVREVARGQALIARVGYGEGEQVAHGRWTQAVTHVTPREGRPTRHAAALRPQERLAALLGGRDAPLAAEELALRARQDLDAGRRREAALQLRIALEAALAELEPWRDQLSERIADLRDARGVVGAAANAALQGGVDDATTAEVEAVLTRLESALRARVAAGLD